MRRRRQKGRYPGFAIKGHSKFANGDRYARRDLMDIAKELGVDLLAGQKRKSRSIGADPTSHPRHSATHPVFGIATNRPCRCSAG
jgi:hypothetical protein